MKLLLATNAAPFVRGGAELMVDRLMRELRDAGHEVDLLRIPLGNTPEEIVDSTIYASLLQAVNVDRVIGLKYPAYLIPHEDVVIWLVHQFRQAYEPPPVGWPSDPQLDRVVDVVRTADANALPRAKRIYAISPMIADRLEENSGIRAGILMTPPHSDTDYRTAPAEDFIVALGRVSDGKRQRLAIEAMRHVRSDVRLVVAGAAESPQVAADLRNLIETNSLGDRVELIDRFISDDEKVDLLSRCLGSVYLPMNEDSYGYVCYEAAMSRKPSVTCSDSGGTLTLVKDGRTGLVPSPHPQRIASAFDKLAGDRDRAREMGENAYALALELDLSWAQVVKELTR
ncbi:glycosyltransferase [Xylanimonas allomyrinae]|uniref:Glycosyltransferase n=1 Tax=Xylanimonas allomyrinae TaxID=2509459 RepID=A0A4P6ESK5_9MICO|nr:glycosyltransferase family 4 protein [Xylanimonas allomyrinae]QAY63387.1 glycosyltransferase [Xylanimonas allomyrinae]